MKTKITLLVALLLLVGGRKAKASSLTININKQYGTTYYITVNGQQTYQTIDNISINDLRGGDHHISITKQVKKGYKKRGRRNYNNHHGYNQAHVKDILVFDGLVNIPGRSEVFAALNYQNLVVTNIIRKNRPTNYSPVSCETPPVVYHEPAAPVIQEMDPYSFRQLKKTIRQEPFGRNKMAILNPVLQQNYFTTGQVLELMALFTFEREKLEVAKYAYESTIDQGNYYVVNNGFTFGSSKRELTNYINRA